jgi:hypothetical protein
MRIRSRIWAWRMRRRRRKIVGNMHPDISSYVSQFPRPRMTEIGGDGSDWIGERRRNGEDTSTHKETEGSLPDA